LTSFILTLMPASIEINTIKNSNWTQIVNVEFLEAFVNDSNRKYSMNVVNYAKAVKFSPERSFLEWILCRIVSFNVPSMEVNADWLIQLISLRLDICEKGSWTFIVDRTMSDDELRQRAIAAGV
ncbi:hypothetical protein PFISCL1PPCAC_18234, partial [Pristionchus fissidentatus]